VLEQALSSYDPQPVWVSTEGRTKCEKVDVPSWTELERAVKRQIGPFKFVDEGWKGFIVKAEKNHMYYPFFFSESECRKQGLGEGR
jgi:hypothetical protein